MYKTIASLIIWPIWIFYMLASLILLFFSLYLVPKKYFYFLLRIWCWCACFFAGQWLKKEGKAPMVDEGPYLYMFNHVSLFDQFMVSAFLGHYVTAVAALEQFKCPIWGSVGRKYGAIPIVRTKINKAINALNKAEKEINKGISIIIAPEGTRTTTGEIGDFKKGPFHLASNTGATIIPIGLIGAFEAKKKTDWRLKPGVLITRFGKPIHKKEYEGLSINEMRDMVKGKIIELINKG